MRPALTLSTAKSLPSKGIFPRPGSPCFEPIWLSEISPPSRTEPPSFIVNAVSNFAWEDGGLSSDPGGALRVALTMSNVAATAAAGDVSVIVTYVVD